MTKIRIIVVLVVGISLILLFLAYQLLAPGDTIQQTGPDNGTIVFSADHGMVFTSGMCVTVRWQVDHIQAVFINGQPTVGQGFQQICVDQSTMPVLHVKFQDNTAADYTLTIGFLVEQPSTWLLFGAAVLLGLVTLYGALSRPQIASTQTVPAKTSARRTPRVIWLFAGIGMVTTAVLVIGLAAELGLRFYFSSYGTAYQKQSYLETRAEIDAQQTNYLVMPSVGYGLSPNYPGQNALGYRGDPIQVPKPKSVYRIVVLGDSSTYGTFDDYTQTYPYDLQQILRSDYGDTNVEVINAGVVRYNTWNMLADLEFRITALQPDLVIVYAAYNDIDAREVPPDCYSGASPFLGLDPRRIVQAQARDIIPSALYRLIAINLQWINNPSTFDDGFDTSQIGCSPQVVDDFPQYLQANPPIYFERNIRNMIGVAQASGFKIMFMTWADNPADPQVPKYRIPEVAAHNAITVRVAQETNTLLFDYAAVAPNDPSLWFDFSHHNPQGNQLQAQAIAKFLLDQNVIPKPSSSSS